MVKKLTINYFIVFSIGLSVGFSSVVWAKNPNMAVSKRDSNGDGKVSLSEWEKPEFVFRKIDFNSDGFITANEFARKWGIPMPGESSTERSVYEAGALDESNVIIADVHMHPHPGNHPIDQLTWMNRNGVMWAGSGSMSRHALDHYARVMKNRFIPFGAQGEMHQIYNQHGVSGVEDNQTQLFESMMSDLESQFENSEIKGIGELFINNRTTNPKHSMRRKTRVDAQSYKDLLDLVANYGGVLSVHVQWDYDSIEQLQALADHNPAGNIIWAHCGNDGSASQVREILQDHDNLYCDLAARHRPKLNDWVINNRPNAQIFTTYSLDSAWKDLIESMPDRFMVGTDTKTESHYDQGINNIRNGLLANLNPETAEKVAYKNAQTLLNLK